MGETKGTWKKRGCLVAGILLAAGMILVGWSLKKGLTPWRLQDKDPRDMFELFVCEPIPDSVKNIEASGTIAFAGGGAYITFEIDPEDVDMVIERGEFRPAGGGLPEWLRDKHPDINADNAMRLRRGDGEMDNIMLYICGDRTKCWFVASYM